MAGQMKLGIIGGSFDPIHLGHLGIAEDAREAFGLDKVIFVPAAQPPHKGGWVLAPAEDRIEMVRLAIADNPSFAASDVEMRRQGPSYTIDTLAEFKTKYPEATIYFIVGADSLRDLPTWRRAKDLVAGFEFLIVGRPGIAGPDVAKLVDAFGPDGAEKLQRNYLGAASYNISATEVRDRVKAGKSIRYLVPDEVAKYILRKGLYT